MEEIWKDIEGYEGLYQVSNLGRVKSLRKNIIIRKKENNGYERVHLCTNNIQKNYYIHRLVANAFIPNPNNYLEINHKDEDKTNNCAENLEWCSHKYNSSYGTRGKRISLKNTNGKKSKITLQYDINGNLIKEWKSINDIQRNLGFAQSNISRCCRGKLKTAYGFLWRYKNEEG